MPLCEWEMGPNTSHILPFLPLSIAPTGPSAFQSPDPKPLQPFSHTLLWSVPSAHFYSNLSRSPRQEWPQGAEEGKHSQVRLFRTTLRTGSREKGKGSLWGSCWGSKQVAAGVMQSLVLKGTRRERGCAGLCVTWKQRAVFGGLLMLFPTGDSSSPHLSHSESIFGSVSPWALRLALPSTQLALKPEFG